MTTLNDAIAGLHQMIWIVMHKTQGFDISKDDRFLKSDRDVCDYLIEQEKAEAVDKTEGYILGEPSIQKLRDDLALAKEGLRLAKVLILCIRSEDYEKKANRFLNICGKLGINEKD